MTDRTTCRVTHEMLAELRQDVSRVVFAESPGAFGPHRIARILAALPALLDAAELLADVRDQVTRGALCPMCSTGMIRRTVGLVCQLCGTDYSRPKYASMRVNALPALLDAAAERDDLRAALRYREEQVTRAPKENER